MSNPALQLSPAIQASATEILTATLGGPVRLGAAEPLLERATIFRVPLRDGPPDAPSRVIVKAATPRDDASWDAKATGSRSLAWRLFNDWAGLQFLQEQGISPALAPRFYGGDGILGFIVVEDLGDGQEVGQDASTRSFAPLRMTESANAVALRTRVKARIRNTQYAIRNTCYRSAKPSRMRAMWRAARTKWSRRTCSSGAWVRESG